MKIKAEMELKDVNTKRLNDLISRKNNYRLKIRLKGEKKASTFLKKALPKSQILFCYCLQIISSITIKYCTPINKGQNRCNNRGNCIWSQNDCPLINNLMSFGRM